ncbi:MAG TPA: DNA topoisomerase IB [Verrucomicrobiae bacterium]|nr:DNA topoisomerase IB [Verrucomicrobiae bacterium]
MPPASLTRLAESAHAMGLRYVTDQMPGIRRERAGLGFRYRYPTGELVHDLEVLRRIRSLAIPPAWTQVWICPDPAGHLQATGRDDRRRKQSRYHPSWREIRDQTKYARMIGFAKALPKIRRRVAHDLALRGLPQAKVLASVVRLLEVSLIRVGNQEYARENESFGLTTLRNRHVEVHGSNLRFHFRGKSGKWHNVDIRDGGLARIIRTCQELPGQELFQFVNDEGKRQTVSSEDVNQYLREISGQDFTAKDFRTWAGTMLAAVALSALAPVGSQTQAKRNVADAIRSVAERLGNTPTVCRKCYIHPEILESYLHGTLKEHFHGLPGLPGTEDLRKLRPVEKAVLKFLEGRVATAKPSLESLLRASLRSRRRASRL